MKFQVPPYVHSFPAPVVLIGCGDVEHPNLITCSWFGVVCSEPPMVNVSIRKSRFSYHLVEGNREFTVNIPRRKDLNAVRLCGVQSGETVDKFAKLRLTPVACPPLAQAPMIQEFPMVLACQVKQIIELGTHDMFISEVVGFHCEESLRRDPARPDPFGTDQLVYLDGKYWSLVPIE
jgi:flavin reductase (DIM6/NTAB) family NADH-FMN oxidoreductase RutF